MDSDASTVSLLIAAYDAAVAACDPEVAVAGAISVDVGGITVGGQWFDGATPADVVVVAVGKAASAMVRGVARTLGSVRGLAVSNHTGDCPVPLLVGAHPVPDETSAACGEALLTFVGSLEPNDIVVYLISGGGSSVAVAPVAGVSVSDLGDLNRVLMVAGMPIGEMNEIRASVSRLKGGRLAAVSTAGRSVTLVLSDVVGAGPSHVASGPTLGAGMGNDAVDIVARYGIEDAVPASTMTAMRHSTRSPDAHEPFSIVGSTEVAARAAARYLESRGVATVIATTRLAGEASVEARRFVAGSERGFVTIATGETTVTVNGDGVGGRNQEAALAVAVAGVERDTVFLACGTDGIDGPTPAAGAVVDSRTSARADALGLDLEASLSNNDSYRVLEALDAVVVTGDTGTNVADLWMVAKGVDGGQGA